jgi:hypothetical protein
MLTQWKLQKHNNPWPYVIIDNFFDDDMWSYLTENLVENPARYFSKFKDQFKNGVEKSELSFSENDTSKPKYGLLYGPLDRLVERGNRRSYEPHNDPKITNYFLKHTGEDFMKEHFKTWRSFTKLGTYVACKYNHIQYGQCSIHHETEDKVLSVSTYISPEHNTGTIVYDQNKVFKHVVTWKPNRALIFPGINNVTWHDFMQTEPEPVRVTLDFFLTRSNSEINLPMYSIE